MARESKRTRNERRYGKPERLADRAFSDQWKLPFWLRDCADEFRDSAFKIRKTFLENLDRATVVDASNASEFFYADNPKEFWNITDFPCCAPPREMLFVEMGRPSRILSEGTVLSAKHIPEYTGILFMYTHRDKIIEEYDSEESRQKLLTQLEKVLSSLNGKIDIPSIIKAKDGGREEIAKLSAIEQSFLMAAVQYMAIKRGVKASDSLPEDLEWAMRAEIVIGGMNIICYLGDANYGIAKNGTILNRPSFSLLGGPSVRDNEAKVAIQVLEQSVDPALLALSFMHCKNVVLETQEPDRSINNERRRAGLKPFVRYHTINIEPMKKVLKSEGNSDTQGLQKALHICRGHFSTYSEEKPLFGRIAGTFWIPSHVRGSIKEGVVVSDYKVKM